MKILQIPVSKQRGSVMLESLIAILIFSMGILALVAMLGVSVKNTTSAKYRSEASLLVNQVIGEMWVGDKTNAALTSAYASATGGAKYAAWKEKVEETLPGVSDDNAPTIAIDGDNMVTVTVYWQAPGDTEQHQYAAVTHIHD